MNAAGDQDNRLAFSNQFFNTPLHSAGVSQQLLYVAVIFEPLQGFGAADGGQKKWVPFGRSTHLLHPHAVTLLVQQAKVGRDLLPVCQFPVRSHLEAKELLR